MARVVIVEPGQCLEDIALQEYGSIDGVMELVADNTIVMFVPFGVRLQRALERSVSGSSPASDAVLVNGISTRLEPGVRLVVRDEPVDRVMHSAMRRLGVVPATLGDQEPPPLGTDGDFNGDFNDDHFVTND